MGINEIHDGRDTLLTVRMENLRKVQKREGEASGGGREFYQQVFEFAEHENKEEEKDHKDKVEVTPPPPPASIPRAITQEDIDAVKKRNELKPGQLIDVEA